MFYASFALFLLWFLFYRRLWKKTSKGEREGPGLGTFDPLGRALYLGLRPYLSDWEEERRKQVALLVSPYALEEVYQRMEGELWRDLFLLLGLLPLGLAIHPLVFLVFCCFPVLRIFSDQESLRKKTKAIKEDLEEELPQMLTQFVLALRSGVLPYQAWMDLAQKGKGPLYGEMRALLLRMEGGVSLRVAMQEFGRKFELPALQEAGEILYQGMETGSGELASGLERLRSSLFENRSRSYKLRAEEASQQMIFPSLLLFLGILLLVLVPIFGRGF